LIIIDDAIIVRGGSRKSGTDSDGRNSTCTRERMAGKCTVPIQIFLRGKEWFKITEMKKQKTGYDAVERKY